LKNSFKYLIILLAGMAFVLNSCKEDCPSCQDPTNSDCENYDPCHSSKPANADFTINEQINFTDFYYETDTIYRTNGTLFKPKYEADSITWLLGSEVVAQEELFRKGYPLGWIEVTMIANMNPSACLSEAERADTVTKQFFVLPFALSDSSTYKASPWWGTWEGYNTDAPDDKFTVSYGYVKGGVSPIEAQMDFVGLPKGIGKQIPFYNGNHSKSAQIDVHVGYNALVMRNTIGQYWDFDGFGLEAVCHRDGNQVTMDYSYNDTPYQRWLNREEREAEPIIPVSKTFIATKISNDVITE
jgi:hypothetical protein